MAWSEYKNSYQSIGRLMYCLSSCGIPVRIVEDLIFGSNSQITYGQKEPFAKYHWVDNTPVLQFDLKYVHYQEQYDANIRFVK